MRGQRIPFPRFVRGQVEIGEVLNTRAKVQADFARSKETEEPAPQLPPIPEYNWEMLKIGTTAEDFKDETPMIWFLSPGNQIEERNLSNFKPEVYTR